MSTLWTQVGASKKRKKGDEGEDTEFEGHTITNVEWMRGLSYTLEPKTYRLMWELGEMYCDEVYRRSPKVAHCR